jgi:hypothetical protein
MAAASVSSELTTAPMVASPTKSEKALRNTSKVP